MISSSLTYDKQPDENQRRLFVTLSNLSFLPAIVLALSWQHFHLAIIYVITMTCSMLYHWCDSSPMWPSSSDCVIQYDTLQFSDFFTAGVSMWATLLAMAVVGQRIKIACLTIAFITFAISVHSDRFHLATFIVPIGIAVLLVIVSWFYRCRRLKLNIPNADLIRLSVGVVFSLVAAILYICFQDGISYEYVHGLWHVIIQLSACCLIPRPLQDNARNRQAAAYSLLMGPRKSWIMSNFPWLDPNWWRRLKRPHFWRHQTDDCFGISDNQSTTTFGSRPTSQSPPPSPPPTPASPEQLATQAENQTIRSSLKVPSVNTSRRNSPSNGCYENETCNDV